MNEFVIGIQYLYFVILLNDYYEVKYKYGMDRATSRYINKYPKEQMNV